MSRNPQQQPRFPVTNLNASSPAIIAFSNMTDLTVKATCRETLLCEPWGKGMFVQTQICASFCSQTDGASLLIPVMSIKLRRLTGREQHEAGTAGKTQGRGNCCTRQVYDKLGDHLLAHRLAYLT